MTTRDYAAWPEPHLVIDTAQTSAEEATAIAVAAALELAARA